MRAPLRLAVLGTPRSGNTWLRRVLATAYAFEGEAGWERSVHDPAEVDWGAEPARSIVQIHLRREAGFEATMAGHGIRAVVPRRHPFDVLISILQYATHVHDTHLWLAGEGGDESAIRGLDPNHPAFLGYATGPRAKALLAVSPEWRDAPGAVSVRYEDLVERPLPTLRGVAEGLGQPPVVAWESALAANTMDELRKTHGFGHIWKGRPGLWRLLLTPASASALAEAHRPLLDSFGEPADPDPALTPDTALAHWRAL
ncbi:MAG TPA: hypothetical protein VGH33_04290, partial [Isosphaeraceae bacterium]